MLRQFIRKLGIIRTTLLSTALSVVISVFLTVAIMLLADLDPRSMVVGLIISITAPVIIMMPISFTILRLLAQVEEAERERSQLVAELQDALDAAKTLSGLLPICASCKKIRDDEGYWHQVEVYVRDRSEADFSHGMCPGCAKKLYAELEAFKSRK
ncbi:MAG: hypothetical protein GY803_25640 [Chloroflexi bacterium]|nr:hypothetical protein [Chloroflexota bacterium]